MSQEIKKIEELLKCEELRIIYPYRIGNDIFNKKKYDVLDVRDKCGKKLVIILEKQNEGDK